MIYLILLCIINMFSYLMNQIHYILFIKNQMSTDIVKPIEKKNFSYKIKRKRMELLPFYWKYK